MAESFPKASPLHNWKRSIDPLHELILILDLMESEIPGPGFRSPVGPAGFGERIRKIFEDNVKMVRKIAFGKASASEGIQNMKHDDMMFHASGRHEVETLPSF